MLTVLLLAIVESSAPQKQSKGFSLLPTDKGPWGLYILNERIGDFFSEVKQEYVTLSELEESRESTKNRLTLIISKKFSPSESDINVAKFRMIKGEKIVVAAASFSEEFTERFGCPSRRVFPGNPFEKQEEKYKFSMRNKVYENRIAPGFFDMAFSPTDSLEENFEPFLFGDSLGHKTAILGIRQTFGDGELVLLTCPAVFTNKALLEGESAAFVADFLNEFEEKRTLVWDGYFQTGRKESRTPLRFILQNEPLRRAWFLTLILLGIFVVFGVKRRQRSVPVVAPPANDSLDFVQTVGQLFYNHADHRGIALKRWDVFLEKSVSRWGIDSSVEEERLIGLLAGKFGESPENIRDLFFKLTFIRKQKQITSDQLLRFSMELDRLTS